METIVVKEVLEPMSKIGWGHGTPPPPDYSTTPSGGQPGTEGAPRPAAAPAAAAQGGQPAAKSAAPAPTDTPKADNPDLAALYASFEALRDPETGLIERKYKTTLDAINGRVHLNTMAKQAFSERDALLKRVAELEKQPSQPAAAPAAAAPQPAPALAASRVSVDQAQARLDKVLSDIAENGGILDAEAAKAMSKASRELADASADARAQERLAERDSSQSTDEREWKAVDAYMRTAYPAAERFSDEVALHMQSDSLLTEAVNALLAKGNKRGATELAWRSFEAVHGAKVAAQDRAKDEATEADLAAREQVRKEAVEKARKDAGVIVGSAGGAGAHENRNAAGASREEIAASVEAMRREGDAPGSAAAMRFRKMVIPLDPSIFGPQ